MFPERAHTRYNVEPTEASTATSPQIDYKVICGRYWVQVNSSLRLSTLIMVSINIRVRKVQIGWLAGGVQAGSSSPSLSRMGCLSNTCSGSGDAQALRRADHSGQPRLRGGHQCQADTKTKRAGKDTMKLAYYILCKRMHGSCREYLALCEELVEFRKTVVYEIQV